MVTRNDYASIAEAFIKELPYKEPPFSSRNWGGKRHSLCSYHGKLKPSIAHFLISEFTDPGEIVLDPLCGVGTIPYEACRQGRVGVGNDLSYLAYCVSKAKLENPSLDEVIEVLDLLEEYIEANRGNLPVEAIPYSEFGFNKTLADYFHPRTLEEIVLARQYFREIPDISAAQAMVMSSVAHILHGNRPYALSRRSHPLTPYAPKGDFQYKNLVEHSTSKIMLTYTDSLPDSFQTGRAILGDYGDLSGINADAVITSPPFAGSLKFYMQNWMRLWFAGWEPDKFESASRDFLDVKQSIDFSIYRSFFEVCSNNMKPNGIMVLHLGRNQKYDMAKLIQPFALDSFDIVYCAEESVENLEKHGIKDKGGTSDHQFLFLQRKSQSC